MTPEWPTHRSTDWAIILAAIPTGDARMLAARVEVEYTHRRALVKIGAWYCECCILDLYQVETEQDERDLLARLDDDYAHEEWGMAPRIWATEREALETLRREADPEEYAKIDARLAKVDVKP